MQIHFIKSIIYTKLHRFLENNFNHFNEIYSTANCRVIKRRS